MFFVCLPWNQFYQWLHEDLCESVCEFVFIFCVKNSFLPFSNQNENTHFNRLFIGIELKRATRNLLHSLHHSFVNFFAFDYDEKNCFYSRIIKTMILPHTGLSVQTSRLMCFEYRSDSTV